MTEGKIRPLVLCIVKKQDKILVADGYDSVKDQKFYRILGGGIEFGERGEDALRREFQEEIATDLENIKFVTTIENLFTFNGKQGHQIVLVFEADLVNKDLYEKTSINILDSNREWKASWENISDFKDKKLILYPDNILEYI